MKLNDWILFVALHVLAFAVSFKYAWQYGEECNAKQQIISLNSKILQVEYSRYARVGWVDTQVHLWLEFGFKKKIYREQALAFVGHSYVNYTVGDNYRVDVVIYDDMYQWIATAEYPKNYKLIYSGLVVAWFMCLAIVEALVYDFKRLPTPEVARIELCADCTAKIRGDK